MRCLSLLTQQPAEGGVDAPPVVLLPYAGAMVSPAALIRPALARAAAVYTATYPGHGRAAGAPLSDPEPLLAMLADDLAELAGSVAAPVLVGFSMGARLAYELAVRLHTGDAPPAGLVLCVSRAPHTGTGHRPIANLPEAEFGPTAARLGLVAAELLGLPGADSLLRVLRADLAIVERMPTARGPALALPATVVGATADWLVPEPALRRWADLVVDPVQLRVPGGHLDWLQAPAAMTAAVESGIAHVFLNAAVPGSASGIGRADRA